VSLQTGESSHLERLSDQSSDTQNIVSDLDCGIEAILPSGWIDSSDYGSKIFCAFHVKTDPSAEIEGTLDSVAAEVER